MEWFSKAAALTGILIVLYLCNYRVAACSGEILHSSSGTVICPDSWFFSTYSNNLDERWSLNYFPSQTFRIKFSKLDVETCCDKVHIYEGSYYSDAYEKFRLTSPDVIYSDFYTSGTTLVRFKTDGGVYRTGFQFTYSASYYSIPAATEVIRQTSGTRVSHPNFGSKNYPNYYKLAWSIPVPYSYYPLITIRFTTFLTNSNYDFLRVYPGAVPYSGSEVLHSMSGSQSYVVLQYPYSVTLLFESSGFATNMGFSFDFNVESSANYPIESKSVRIELIKPDLWPTTGVIEFRAVSDASCSIVRHQCRVTTVRGRSVQAQQIFSIFAGCSFSTRFKLEMHLSELANSVVACQLRNGSFAIRNFILPQEQLTWDFSDWIGQSGSRSFSVSANPATSGIEGLCSLRDECGMEVMKVAGTNRTINGSTATLHFSHLLANQSDELQACVTEFSCRLSVSANGWQLAKTRIPYIAHPLSAKISLINDEDWSPENENEFLAESEFVCSSSAQHACYLEALNASSVTEAHAVNISKTAALNNSCHTPFTLTTRFSLPGNTSINEGDVIACRLAGGRLEVLQLVSDAARQSQKLKRRMLLMSSVAVAMVALLLTFCGLLASGLVTCRLHQRRQLNTQESVGQQQMKQVQSPENASSYVYSADCCDMNETAEVYVA